jgi:hypothetical protein
MMFDDLVFTTDPLFDIKRAQMTIGQFVLSVILEPSKSLYEIAVFDKDGEFVRLPGIGDGTDDVVPYLSEDDVSCIIRKLQSAAGPVECV